MPPMRSGPGWPPGASSRARIDRGRSLTMPTDDESYPMDDNSRNLIVLSDGTGNSASKPFKTNVWRLYQALNLRDGKQVAVFGDGVGTSSITILRIIGLALGVGVK